MNNTTGSPDYMFLVYGVSLLINSVGILGNALIIITFIKHNILHQNGLIFIGLLAVGDLMVGIGGAYISVFFIIDKLFPSTPLTNLNCLLVNLPAISGLYSSHVVTALLAHDRFMAMARPWQYFHRGNRPLHVMPKLLLVLFYGVCNGLVTLPFVDLSAATTTCALGQIAPERVAIYYEVTVLTIGSLVAYYYLRAILATKGFTSKVGSQSELETKKEFEMKIMRTARTVLTVYCLVWIVPNVGFVVAIAAGWQPALRGVYGDILGLLAGVNSACNTLIYSTKSSIIRPYLVVTIKDMTKVFR